MKCQSLFFLGKIKKNISNCHLLDFFSQHAKHYTILVYFVTNIEKPTG